MKDHRATKEYWNERVRNRKFDSKGERDIVYQHVDFERFDAETRKILEVFKDKKVLDVGCGYGRLADVIPNYTGIDFSEEMIALAKAKHPHKRFFVAEHLDEQFDVVFEAMCLSSFGISPREFADRYPNSIVVCFEPKEFNIFYQ